ncbi:hypothetical protein I4F81_003382 [Pyropia yezoensis]|uniref:Uncharacterized protein n=1 Tax=Pyropia yezoensis TaxID=2788 RepID=A0ACC3BSS4_PYRYE|nr:hypothetical protein I4F81_003382 [Neopyropia yezoensis]
MPSSPFPTRLDHLPLSSLSMNGPMGTSWGGAAAVTAAAAAAVAAAAVTLLPARPPPDPAAIAASEGGRRSPPRQRSLRRGRPRADRGHPSKGVGWSRSAARRLWVVLPIGVEASVGARRPHGRVPSPDAPPPNTLTAHTHPQRSPSRTPPPAPP